MTYFSFIEERRMQKMKEYEYFISQNTQTRATKSVLNSIFKNKNMSQNLNKKDYEFDSIYKLRQQALIKEWNERKRKVIDGEWSDEFINVLNGIKESALMGKDCFFTSFESAEYASELCKDLEALGYNASYANDEEKPWLYSVCVPLTK